MGKRRIFHICCHRRLPLRAYVATISIKKKTKTLTELTWQSYLNSQKMSEKQFLEFLVFMGSFYEASLENLKILRKIRLVIFWVKI